MDLGNDESMDTPSNSPNVNSKEPSQFLPEKIRKRNVDANMQEFEESGNMYLSPQRLPVEASSSNTIIPDAEEGTVPGKLPRMDTPNEYTMEKFFNEWQRQPVTDTKIRCFEYDYTVALPTEYEHSKPCNEVQI